MFNQTSIQISGSVLHALGIWLNLKRGRAQVIQWPWGITYGDPILGMNIHLPPILMFTRGFPGFRPPQPPRRLRCLGPPPASSTPRRRPPRPGRRAQASLKLPGSRKWTEPKNRWRLNLPPALGLVAVDPPATSENHDLGGLSGKPNLISTKK